MRGFPLVWCLFLLIFLAYCGEQEKPLIIDLKSSPVIITDDSKSDNEIRFAVAPVLSPEKTFVSYQVLTKYLAEHLKIPVKLIQRKTYLEINEMLRNGSVQFALICTGAFIIAREEFDLEPVVIPRYRGKSEYYSLIIVKRDSPIKDIRELEGKKIALSDPLSNSGYFYPMFLVMKMGKDPSKFFKGMLFTYSHDSSISAVREGIVDVAAVDSLIFEHELYLDKELDSSIRVIHKSPPFGINPVVASSKTPRDIKEAVKHILLGMHSNPEGKRILNLLRIDEFIEPPQGIYESTREMILWVRARQGAQ
jgi:phosphonate transport system substrate-binding protein